MKIRTATKPNAKGAYTITRDSNVVSVWTDTGKDWRRESRYEFDTVRQAKEFMNRPQI